MTKIAERVYFIAGRDEAIPDSHVYIIGDPDSKDLSMVDVGLVGKGDYKVKSLNGLGVEKEDIKRVIMTHTHMDHIGCLREIRSRMPWVEVWIHREEAEPLEEGDERTVYGMEMFRSMCEAQYGLKPGDFRMDVDRKLEDGEILEIGGMSWEVLHVPGHSCGSIALYNRQGKILIPGDVVYADYAIGRFDLHNADGSVLKDSLKRLAELEVDILLPGHNRIVKGLPPGYILETLRQWEPYLN
ncbi:MAG: MBL fold metallo-hydrolase [Deltaproteobacteria bacterium]|nr:MBL fold metallo-hydrolase [Deltaproteobacteria bacterium]